MAAIPSTPAGPAAGGHRATRATLTGLLVVNAVLLLAALIIMLLPSPGPEITRYPQPAPLPAPTHLR